MSRPNGMTIDRDRRSSAPAGFERLVAVFRRRIELGTPVDNIDRARRLVLGVGCERGVSSALFERGVARVLLDHGLSEATLHALASIDNKRDEAAILAFAEKRGLAVRFFSARELDAIGCGDAGSARVKQYVGTGSVCEPAALLAARAEQLLVPKTIYTEPGVAGSVTVAVARMR